MTLRWRLAFALILGLGLGVAGGYGWAVSSNASLATALRASLAPIQDSNSGYKLVRPLLAYRTPEATAYGEFTDLDAALTADIDRLQQEPGVNRIAVYFRDLDTARWVGIRQDDAYHPASLLKVPLMIAFYKEAETDPLLLTKSVTYQAFSNLPAFEAPSELVVGKAYTVNELIDTMITDSDNGATFTLLDQISSGALDDTYSALGIAIPGDGATDYQISARTYGLFFRILYNATYLSPAYSQKALDLLSKATFADGLAAGIPGSTLLAHKYGEHVEGSGTTVTAIELSDCGIVYYPKHPYLLCVMASTKDVPTATSVISTLSKTAYDKFAKQYPE